MSIAINEGVSERLLLDLYSDPYITRVGHDHRPAAPISHPLVTYLSASVNGEFVGAFMAIQQTAVEIDLHALLKKSAVLHSRKIGKEVIRWAFESRPILRITAYVIEGLESAKNYCLKLGMTMEGFRRDACVQHGKIKGVYILGMTRAEWGRL